MVLRQRRGRSENCADGFERLGQPGCGGRRVSEIRVREVAAAGGVDRMRREGENCRVGGSEGAVGASIGAGELFVSEEARDERVLELRGVREGNEVRDMEVSEAHREQTVLREGS